MKVVRPHIPISVRLEVAARQCMQRDLARAVFEASLLKREVDQLALMLRALFGDEPTHLDHDPPLCLRHVRPNGEYDPPANSAEHLVYRTAEEHRIKTFVRGDGAQLSDAAKRRKEVGRRKRLVRLKRAWASRPFPSRPFPGSWR